MKDFFEKLEYKINTIDLNNHQIENIQENAEKAVDVLEKFLMQLDNRDIKDDQFDIFGNIYFEIEKIQSYLKILANAQEIAKERAE